MGASRLRVPGLLAACLTCLLALFAVPSRAAGDGISIVGSRTGFVDVTVYESGQIAESEVVVRTNGRFGGFLLVPTTTTRPVVGAFYLPRVGADGRGGGRLVAVGDWQVYAGGYRLYLVGETHTDVFVPLPGAGYRAVRPARSAPIGYRQVDFVAPAGASASERRVGVRAGARRGTLVLAAELVSSAAATGIDFPYTCVIPARSDCRAPVVPAVRASVASTRVADATVVEPGRYEAVFDVARGPGVHGDSRVTGELLVLPLHA